MESRAKLFGHPAHTILIAFPVGLLMTALIFDIAYLATNNAQFAIVSYWMIVAGVLGGLISAVFGLVDWFAIPGGTRAKAVGLWHGVGNVAALLLFVISGWLRSPLPQAPNWAAITLGVIGVGILGITGWLGGELVHRLNIGNDEGAHPNAPSSLSGLRATEKQGAAEGQRDEETGLTDRTGPRPTPTG